MSFNDRIIDEFRANGGEVDRFGHGLILVHHIGAKSSTERVSPVMGLPSEAGWLVAASKGGSDENPAWYYNLVANPDVMIETPDDPVVPVRAVELTGPERAAAWARFLTASPAFAQYEQRTPRTIPVLELRRR
ncbi:nitroreductase family deazaflavin-dependent oxidoreductase [soil metagenome]